MYSQIVPPAVAVTGVSVQPAVSVVQPTVVMSPMPMVTVVPDHLCYSIFTTLCCCLPLGIAAIAYSCSTQEANRTGQRELAMSYSRTALILNNLALGLGLTIIAVAIILVFTVL